MTAFLLVAVVVVVALGVAGVWLMERAGVDPAARASGEAPDPEEENEVRERVDGESAPGAGGLLEERPGT